MSDVARTALRVVQKEIPDRVFSWVPVEEGASEPEPDSSHLPASDMLRLMRAGGYLKSTDPHDRMNSSSVMDWLLPDIALPASGMYPNQTTHVAINPFFQAKVQQAAMAKTLDDPPPVVVTSSHPAFYIGLEVLRRLPDWLKDKLWHYGHVIPWNLNSSSAVTPLQNSEAGHWICIVAYPASRKFSVYDSLSWPINSGVIPEALGMISSVYDTTMGVPSTVWEATSSPSWKQNDGEACGWATSWHAFCLLKFGVVTPDAKPRSLPVFVRSILKRFDKGFIYSYPPV